MTAASRDGNNDQEPSSKRDETGAEPLSLRSFSWMLLFRVLLLSFVLVGIVVANVFGSKVWNFEGTFSKTILTLIAGLYGLSIVAGVTAKWVKSLLPLLYTVLGVDLLATTMAVHLSGGLFSGITVLYMVLVVTAGLTDGRRGAALTMAASSILFIGIVLADRAGLVPLIPGQNHAGSKVPLDVLTRNISITLAALAAVTVLTIHMADQLQQAGKELTKHRRAFDDLAAHHEQILNSLGTGLVSTDLQGTIVTYNPKAAQLLGIPPDRAVGRRLDDVAPQIVRPPGLHRLEIERPSGEPVPVELAVSILADAREQTAGTIYLIRDRTEMERMEREVAEAERLAALGRFASGVAHEIRNPLASISGALELLRHSRPEDEEEARLTDIVLREVDRLDHLITEMLDLVRPAIHTQMELDWSEDIRETTSLARTDPRMKNVEIRLDLSGPVVVMADQQRLRQVYWNLLTNAMAVSPADSAIHVSVTKEANWAVLRIEDQGPGIPKETLEKIFEPFFSTKSDGTGLGLAIARQIVIDHGGRISVESKPGRTVFTVQLPLLDLDQDSETPHT